MHWRFLPRKSTLVILSLLPVSLSAQAVTELSPLEYHPSGREASARIAARKPASFGQQITSLATYRLGSVSRAEMDAVARDPRLPLVGIERPIDARAGTHGQWVTLDDGTAVWRLAIQSDGAAGLRVEFARFNVGAGEVWLYSEDRTQVFGPYSGTGINDSGEFWSHTVFADTAIVEYQPEGPGDNVPFTIIKIAHRLPVEQTMAAGSCELDVSCYPDWSAIASGVGMYVFQSGGASYACSGALVNNTNQDSKPYFLTANHCVSNAAAAASVEVYWKYQTASCNGTAPALSSLPRTLGATYLSSAPIASGDFSLILLSPLPNTTLTFYGWNGSATALPIGGATTGMHHPEADYTRIAFGVRSSDVTAQVGTEIAPATMFYDIQETSGRIEPGSSGSPLFTSDKLVVGTLTYGPAGTACSISPFYAGYGRFSVALPALTAYLSPPASGTPPASNSTVTATPSSIKTSWTIGSGALPAQSIQVTTPSTSAITLTVKASQTWIQPSATTLTVSKASPATLSVTLSTQTFTTAGTNTGSISLTATGISVTIAEEVDVTVPVTAVKGGPATVIPLFMDGAGSTTVFTLVNPYATATVASITFDAASGAAATLPLGLAGTLSWQNVTIPAWGTATVTTAGTSSPQKQGLAIVQAGDPAKRVQAWAQIGADAIVPALFTTPTFVVPFDATGTASTTLYLFNPAATGTLNLTLSIYDTTGALIGTGTIAIPAQQEGAIPMTKTAAVFGGKKGILMVYGSAGVSAMGIRTATDGRLSSVVPETLTPQ